MKMNDEQLQTSPETEEKENTTEFPTVAAVEPEYTEPRKAARAKKKRGFLKNLVKEVAAEKETVRELAPPVAEDEPDDGMKVYGESGMDDTREVSVSQKTRVLDDIEDDEGSDATQLLLDGFDNEEEPEEGTDEALRRLRREKIQDFSQKREEHERAEAQQAEEPVERGEVIYPETPLETPAPAAETDYTTPAQLGALRQKLQAVKRSAGLSLFAAGIAEIILLFMALISFFSPAVNMSPVAYLIIHLILFGVVLFACGNRVKAGLSCLFGGTATAESGVALAAVLTVVHTALQFVYPGGIVDGTMPLLTAVTGLSLLLMQAADKLEADRISRTFGLIGAKGTKLVAKRIGDSTLAEEIGRPALAIGEPRVTYFRETEFAGDYVRRAEDTVCAHPLMKWYLPLTLAIALVAGVLYLILNGLTAWLMAVTLFCTVICVAAPVLILLYLRAALSAVSTGMRENGTAIVGYDAVREYGSSHAVALDAIDLFPENSVLLHGIKTFSGTRIDEAILDAASVSVRAGGPLSHVFRRMILNKVDMLHEVDTLVYEQDMGLSGWVSGRRVLIGNRKLLDNHGIDIPSKDYEERYTKNQRQLVYLSIAGELSAMFVVSYIADPTVKRMLTDLTSRRITLLVRTCDPNISESLIASTFGLNGFYVELLGAPAGRSFEGLVDGVTDFEPAGIVSVGGMCNMMGALANCKRLRTAVRVFTVLQAVVGIVGMLFTACMALINGALLPPLYAIEFIGITAVLSALTALVFRRH